VISSFSSIIQTCINNPSYIMDMNQQEKKIHDLSSESYFYNTFKSIEPKTFQI